MFNPCLRTLRMLAPMLAAMLSEISGYAHLAIAYFSIEFATQPTYRSARFHHLSQATRVIPDRAAVGLI